MASEDTSEDALDEADLKSRREDVLNQLLVMLNTALAEDKDKKAEMKRKKKKSVADTLEEQEQEADDVDYLHGSLGLVPLE